MEIKGFVKNSFVDWDGKIAVTLFLPGCNFRCGFCHNKPLVLEPDKIKSIPFFEIEEHLETNRKFIDGVVVTGGEPTIHSELSSLLRDIKSLGFPVKLDTNGSNPKAIKNLLQKKLIDYISMDIKSSLENYNEVCGVRVDAEKIKESIKLIMNSGVDYEFRTTIIPEMHGEAEMEKMASMIEGAKLYALQKFIPRDTISKEFENMASPTTEQMEKLKSIAEKHVNKVIIRN
jgi:pyruvate formate lyase activating enzyme